MLIPFLGMSQNTLDRQVIGNAGEYTSTANMNASWTVGEAVVAYATTSNLQVSQGFQQMDAMPVGIAENAFEGEIKVFPNPLVDELNFEIKSMKNLNVQVELFDVTGKLVRALPQLHVVNAYQGKIDFSNLPAGNWLLRFKTENEALKTFRVTKLND